MGKGTKVLSTQLGNTKENEVSEDFNHDFTNFGANIGIGVIVNKDNFNFTVTSAYHSSIKSIFYKQQNKLAEYFTVKIGKMISYSV